MINTEFFAGDVSALATDAIAFTVRERDWKSGALSSALDAMDQALGGWIRTIAKEEDFRAADDTSLVVQTHGRVPAKRIVLLGIGNPEAGNALAATAAVRECAGRAAKAAEAAKLSSVALVADLEAGVDPERAARYAFEGAALALYRFDRLRREQDRKPATVERFVLALRQGGPISLDDASIARADAQAAAVADAVAFARDLVNEPPNVMYPARLAHVAEIVARDAGLEVHVFDKKSIEDMDMQLLLAVNAGSENEPRLVHLVYRPEGADDSTPAVGIVGKGITFDSGGYNLKPGGAIDDMKIDMAGAAAVLGAMKAIRAFSPRVVVHAVIPAAENLVSGNAYKLGDVYRGHNGKTVEIRNTDAEGRLVLIDALGYALKQKVSEVTTLATLTGACVVALGPYSAGVFSNRKELLDGIVDAAAAAGEDVWPLPLSKKLRPMLKSDVADMKNIGERWGGAITAALFLEEFVDETPWIHVDLAGPSYVEKAVEAHIPKGGTGFGILTLLEALCRKGSVRK